MAKNYLSQEEIGELTRIMTMCLDFAEDQARRRKHVFLKDWETKLNEFLRFNERAVLGDKGSVSKTTADARAEGARADAIPGRCGKRGAALRQIGLRASTKVTHC